ncbi:hypothetical protein ACFPIJ_44690 [Dactylosporangium cerinum]|uniref:Uncharacterized protein n=1 Tax=Dactylosporangium cerinum TaxID=1434730 RepID=A0ABV9WB53_9ACTN
MQAEHGWRPEMHHRADAAARYGRTDAGSPAGGFITATRTGSEVTVSGAAG